MDMVPYFSNTNNKYVPSHCPYPVTHADVAS